MSEMNSEVMTSIEIGMSLIGVSMREPEISFVAAYPVSLVVLTVNGSSWTAGAADVLDGAVVVVVVVVVVVPSGFAVVVVVWAPSGRAAATAKAARPERIRSEA